MRTSQKAPDTITTIGVDLGKNTFHLVGLDSRGAVVLQQKVTRGQLERRLANIPRCLIGMEACSGLPPVPSRCACCFLRGCWQTCQRRCLLPSC
jgi:hypothetical protein